MAKYYAWCDIYNGGEVGEVVLPTGNTKNVVINRNVIKRGEQVTKAKTGLSEEDWDRMLESGAIRDYPLPEDASEYISPTQAVLRKFMTPSGEVDTDMLLRLGLSHPPVINPPSEAGAELPVGT